MTGTGSAVGLYLAAAFGATVGLIMGGSSKAAKLQDASDVNERLSNALREAMGHLRMAGLNSAADLAAEALQNSKRDFEC